MKSEDVRIGLLVRVREDVWREWCIRNFKEVTPFKPQPIVQLPGVPPYSEYVILAFPYWLWKPEELEVVE